MSERHQITITLHVVYDENKNIIDAVGDLVRDDEHAVKVKPDDQRLEEWSTATIAGGQPETHALRLMLERLLMVAWRERIT